MYSMQCVEYSNIQNQPRQALSQLSQIYLHTPVVTLYHYSKLDIAIKGNRVEFVPPMLSRVEISKNTMGQNMHDLEENTIDCIKEEKEDECISDSEPIKDQALGTNKMRMKIHEDLPL